MKKRKKEKKKNDIDDERKKEWQVWRISFYTLHRDEKTRSPFFLTPNQNAID